ncbi:MAG: DUF6962 family protein [Sphingobacteriaceae bacterium]
MNYLEISYVWLNNYFCEPTTIITDLILAFFCFWCFRSISNYQNRSESVERWSMFFLFIGISTFFGSIAHSISCDTSSFTYKTVWLVMQITSGLSVFYAQQSVISAEIGDHKQKQNLERFTHVQFVVFAICVVFFMSFKVVAINSAIGLLQLLYFTFPQKIKVWNYNSMVSSGFIISFGSIYVNRNHLSFASWFNYNDIAHMIMLLSLFLIFYGVKHKHRFAMLSNNSES